MIMIMMMIKIMKDDDDDKLGCQQISPFWFHSDFLTTQILHKWKQRFDGILDGILMRASALCKNDVIELCCS